MIAGAIGFFILIAILLITGYVNRNKGDYGG